MNMGLCEGLIKPQSCHGFGCGHSLSKPRDCQSVPALGRQFCNKISDPEKIGHSSLSPTPLSLPFKPVAALSSSLKFLRFSREEDNRKASQIGFQENGDANRVGSGDEEVNISMDDSQSVHMSSLTSLAVDEASGGSRIGVIQSAEHMSRPLVHNFAMLSSFWKKNTVSREASRRSEGESATSLIESCQLIPPSCEFQGCGACCSGSGIDAAAMQVTPHSQIARNKEYFAKFLYCVPSVERERITQMALLSNLAYRIPTIEEDKLLSDQHFRVITSSFELKASDAPAGDGKGSVTEEVVTEIRESVLGLEGTDAKSHLINERTMASLNPAAGYAMAATAASCNAQACDLLLSKSESNTSAIGDEVGGDCRDYKDVPNKRDGVLGVLDKDIRDSSSSSKNPWYLRTASTVLRGARAVSGDQGKQPIPAVAPPGCPCEWFACENEATNTFVVVIQGTETLAAGQANLQFEPTQFEPESKSGIMVHRGIYTAAKRLYDEVFPYIQAHVEAHNEKARIQFTGHSLGGSLAVLLSLMIEVRKAAPVSALLPVYTFGSPCIMCGGNHLLAQLGLPHSHIRSIIMHMDIVPRTFACDYPDHVAVVLKRVSGTFRNHSCLLQQRLIYAPMGEIVIVQPEDNQAPGHPLLPQGIGLYSLRTPSQLGIVQTLNENPLRPERELQSVQRAFLNVPHPLEILSDRNAYGSEGTISRDHDCRNYLKALQLMQHNARKQRRERQLKVRARREFRRQLWTPMLEGGDVSSSHLFRGPKKYICGTEKQGLGLEGQYQDLKSAGDVKSAVQYIPNFFFFRIKQERFGSSSKNNPAIRS